MQLTSSAKGTIAFSIVLALTVIYCNTSAICMSEARSTLIPTIGRVFGPLANGALIVPSTVVLTGAVILGIWIGTRWAFALALALGIVSLPIYIFSGTSFLLAGSFAATLICASVVIGAALTTGYAWKAWAGAGRVTGGAAN